MKQNMKAIDLSYKYMKQEEIMNTKKNEYSIRYFIDILYIFYRYFNI